MNNFLKDLKSLVDKDVITQVDLARAFNRAPPAISRLLSGARQLKINEPAIVAKTLSEKAAAPTTSPQARAAIEEFLELYGLSGAAALIEAPAIHSQIYSGPLPPRPRNMTSATEPMLFPASFGPDLVPILGFADGSTSESYSVDNNGDPIGQVPRHPMQSGIKGAFAVYARGSSMTPRYYEGEIVYIARDRPPQRGQDCIVELLSGHGFLKTFVRTTEKEVICKQLNPEKEWRWALGEVKALHAVVGRA